MSAAGVVSGSAIDWARRAACGGGAEKAVLLLLALRCGDGLCCVVSRGDLAREGEISRQAVERALVTLEGRGLIFRPARAETVEIRLLREKLR
jgi:pyocin large subunit-like protein